MTPLGPAATDRQLAAWRDAMTGHDLPAPARERWQVLRGGVVNLWEFDVAEYWFADGRGQFVGANQSGKSTLMALTTLIMLAGDLDRQYVDTFGQSDKAFRYYVEPTDDARDRRDATAATNRGWAWVEYGRLGADGPEFYTTLLYAQAKRGVAAMPPTWMICRGSARVRDGLELATGQAVVEPKELHDVAGISVFDSGRRYAQRLATELFGFTDTDRYATVLEMLKVLRTPHLGQRLNPDWFTRQIRSALPPIARSEVEELAEGWQQLEQLRRDRDSAREARDAIAVYVNRAWKPWADSVLRLHADELLDADAAVARAGREVAGADGRLAKARHELDAESGRTDELLQAGRAAQTRYEELLRSKAYLDAAGRADHAETLRKEAEGARRHARVAADHAGRTLAESSRRAGRLREAEQSVEAARGRAQAIADHAVQSVSRAGLGDGASDWIGRGDADRLTAAISGRRGSVAVLRKLLRAAAKAVTLWEAADEKAAAARREFASRDEAADGSAELLSSALQQLSDDLERWAVQAGPAAPDVATRERWLGQVTGVVGTRRPRAVLRGLVTGEWLEPAVTPLTEQIGTLRTQAVAADRSAADALALVERLSQDHDPAPAGPQRWTRRERPVSPSADGAPLWRLVDPVTGCDVDGLEAALDAAGLLDAWVTPDSTWSPTRDGHDTVITLPTASGPPDSARPAAVATPDSARPAAAASPDSGRPAAAASPDSARSAAAGSALAESGAGSLAEVLRPAEDAGELGAAIGRILAGIGYAAAGQELGGDVAVSDDGRWVTPVAAGRAGRAVNGAELLGVAARVAARHRRIEELAAQAEESRRTAEELRAEATGLSERVSQLRDLAAQAPEDADAIAAGTAVTAANAERDRAEEILARAEDAAAKAGVASSEATSDLSAHATGEGLPVTDDLLDVVAGELDQAAQAVADLSLALAGRTSAERDLTSSAEAAASAETAADEAAHAATEAASEAQTAELRAAEASVARDDEEQLELARSLDAERAEIDVRVDASRKAGVRLAEIAAKVAGEVEQRKREETGAGQRRASALDAWWVPVGSGLAAARELPAPADRSLGSALEQARVAAQTLRPLNWPDTAQEKARRAQAALAKVVGNPAAELRTVLEASGGRSVLTATPEDDDAGLPAVRILVDASGTQHAPADAIRHLDDLVAELATAHNEKLDQIYTELLSSTFIDHLSDRVKKVQSLLKLVNQVLERHPTGANRTTLRLRRHPAEGQRAGYTILRALENGTIDSSQDDIRAFLGDRVREAQEAGQGSTQDWTEHLAGLLDYRNWFDVVAEFRVEGSDFKPLTKQVHGVDSGGGKVVTLLQPLLATLVALYTESPDSPRPLWLDEAFEGVDPGNRATMLRLLVDFDLDFLLAGPAPLVAAAQVPAAAVWIISRAPAPAPGVDLSLMLWAGRTLEQIVVPDHAGRALTPRRSPEETGPDLFADLD
ncbi:SbcC/MukB-like Walker B domain-containing protein [Winogradskya humida]|uniref:Exonuclease SbcCD C subunit n=1 Tax=Winogradskya humida TaxID=113566 RepID=A0ABQ3ZHK4_9ACTN|nr:SbcC/MukB-like Walker B domain-containing protein [Actinoplanes humidus]GIE18078.1 hypothetical protein Ahu01nite_011800 [Actinoplanes humidus]